tara:strand:+ start:410 stop:607 length:198 start_codon:yes stop_codon:yes gene_type:complete
MAHVPVTPFVVRDGVEDIEFEVLRRIDAGLDETDDVPLAAPDWLVPLRGRTICREYGTDSETKDG